ncbi:MAG: hypothetical protein WD872_06970, partial [Pirellulaceae bacterium]
QIYGDDGDDWIDGGDGQDKLLGNNGDDRLKGGAGNDHLDGGAGVNLLDGDAGKNKFKNGTLVDLDQPPPPPTFPSLVAVSSSEGGKWSEAIYEQQQTPSGLETVLNIGVSNAIPGESLPAIIDGRVIGTITINSEGEGFLRLSSIVDEAGELPWPTGLVIEAGTEITLGPELSGVFVLL